MFPLHRGRRLRVNESIRSLVLNWITSHKNVLLLTSSMSKKNTLENFNSLNIRLEKSDIDKINNKSGGDKKILKIFLQNFNQIRPIVFPGKYARYC